MTNNETLRPAFDRLQMRAVGVGIIGAVLLVIGAFTSAGRFYQSYLYGYVFWVSFTLGCVGILILHHLVSGAWGHIIQRMTESGARTVPFMAILFLPVLFGIKELYPWARPEVVESSHILHAKTGYLNLPFFVVRTVIFFGFWMLVAYMLTGWSRKQDRTGDPSLTRKMKLFSGPAMVFFILAVTFASVDWLMSLEPEWYSTIYGMHIIVSAVLSTLALCIILLRVLSSHAPFSDVLTTRHFHHLGNLLMAFTILWAYMAFSQFLIIWSGNLPEDNFWHLRRMANEWQIMALVLIVGHFFVPFLLLLSRRTKRMINRLAVIAGGILIMRLVDLFWLIMPAFNEHRLQFHWLDIVAPIGIGGIWIALFLGQLKSQPLLPLHDPRFNEKAEYAHPH
jgi:hypothetical protein